MLDELFKEEFDRYPLPETKALWLKPKVTLTLSLALTPTPTPTPTLTVTLTLTPTPTPNPHPHPNQGLHARELLVPSMLGDEQLAYGAGMTRYP